MLIAGFWAIRDHPASRRPGQRRFALPRLHDPAPQRPPAKRLAAPAPAARSATNTARATCDECVWRWWRVDSLVNSFHLCVPPFPLTLLWGAFSPSFSKGAGPHVIKLYTQRPQVGPQPHRSDILRLDLLDELVLALGGAAVGQGEARLQMGAASTGQRRTASCGLGGVVTRRCVCLLPFVCASGASSSPFSFGSSSSGTSTYRIEAGRKSSHAGHPPVSLEWVITPVTRCGIRSCALAPRKSRARKRCRPRRRRGPALRPGAPTPSTVAMVAARPARGTRGKRPAGVRRCTQQCLS